MWKWFGVRFMGSILQDGRNESLYNLMSGHSRPIHRSYATLPEPNLASQVDLPLFQSFVTQYRICIIHCLQDVSCSFSLRFLKIPSTSDPQTAVAISIHPRFRRNALYFRGILGTETNTASNAEWIRIEGCFPVWQQLLLDTLDNEVVSNCSIRIGSRH